VPAFDAGAHSDQSVMVIYTSRIAVVVSQHAAETLSTSDLAFDSTNFFAWFNYQVEQSLMVLFAEVILEEFGSSVPQRFLTKKEHSIESLRF
jgi:hypothetical protein